MKIPSDILYLREGSMKDLNQGTLGCSDDVFPRDEIPDTPRDVDRLVSPDKHLA